MSEKPINDGGPAFPHNVDPFVDHPVHGRVHRAQLGETHTPGMSLRDYFAAAALQGMLCNGFMPVNFADRNYIGAAYAMADAMLAERAKPKSDADVICDLLAKAEVRP